MSYIFYCIDCNIELSNKELIVLGSESLCRSCAIHDAMPIEYDICDDYSHNNDQFFNNKGDSCLKPRS